MSIRPTVSLGTQERPLLLVSVLSMRPAEQGSLLAVEELMRQGGDCIFHLGLRVKAGMSSA